MSAAVQSLAALLEQLNARVAALEGKAGMPVSSAPAASAPAAAAAVDDDLAPQTVDYDALVEKYGKGLEDVASKIGGDVVTLVREGEAPEPEWICQLQERIAKCLLHLL